MGVTVTAQPRGAAGPAGPPHAAPGVDPVTAADVLDDVPADAGWYGPGSATWDLSGDPLVLHAGARALLLQALHPVAMRAVADHSNYRSKPWERLQTTGGYLSTTTYGSRAEADAAAATVRRIHTRIGGHDPVTGTTYRADDPDLLLWIHCALVDSMVEVIGRGRPGGLDPGLADDYLREQVRAARHVGLDPAVVPSSVADLADYLQEVRPLLRVTRVAREAALYILLPPLPPLAPAARLLATPARPLLTGVLVPCFAALPAWARQMYTVSARPATARAEEATTTTLRALRTSIEAARRAVPAMNDPARQRALRGVRERGEDRTITLR